MGLKEKASLNSIKIISYFLFIFLARYLIDC